jgi:endonuclease/exonuclease/phosphatase family metal-dependent hydrolase
VHPSLICPEQRGKTLLLLLFALLPWRLDAQESLRVVAYNLLNFPDPVPAGRADTFAPIAAYMQADLILVCELKTAAGADALLDRGLNTDGNFSWRRAEFLPNISGSGGSLHNMAFFRQEKLALHSQHRVRTHLRDISHYVFFMRDPFLAGHRDTTWLEVYVAHLKAGNSEPDQASRSRMTDSLKQYMDGRPAGRAVVLGGDLNTYTSLEPAYQTLTNPYNAIWLRDPINRPGNWSSNFSMAEVHTQSTRTGLIFGDGSGGGLDDRFDFLLLSSPVLGGSGRFRYVPGSYTALGNNGQCYNQSILLCESSNPVPRRIRTALYYMSDHLPVSLDLEVTYPELTGVQASTAPGEEMLAALHPGGLWVRPGLNLAGQLALYLPDGRLIARTPLSREQALNGSFWPLELPASPLYLLRFDSPDGQSRAIRLGTLR